MSGVRAFKAPIPDELKGASAEDLYVHRELLSYQAASASWKQELEGRMRAIEKSLTQLVKANETSAKADADVSREILKRIGQDDDDGSFGLTGKVGDLARTVGQAPDNEGHGGSGLRGEVALLGKRIQPFERIREAFKTLWPLFLAIGALLAWAWAPTLQALIKPGFHP